jgi:hypothetical protein
MIVSSSSAMDNVVDRGDGERREENSDDERRCPSMRFFISPEILYSTFFPPANLSHLPLQAESVPRGSSLICSGETWPTVWRYSVSKSATFHYSRCRKAVVF